MVSIVEVTTKAQLRRFVGVYRKIGGFLFRK